MDAAQVAEAVFVAARPVPVQVVPGRTAVVVVDMQNDFGSIGGMFEQAGVDISEIRAMIPAMAGLINVARRAGMKIVFLKMAFRADLSDAGLPDSPNWLKHVPLKAGEHVVAPTGVASFGGDESSLGASEDGPPWCWSFDDQRCEVLAGCFAWPCRCTETRPSVLADVMVGAEHPSDRDE